MRTAVALFSIFTALGVNCAPAQTSAPAKPAAGTPRRAAKPATVSLADKLVKMITLKMPDGAIVGAAGKDASKLTSDDLIRLKALLK